MANSIPGPWIVDYLVGIAEEYGANLSAAPWREKGPKAQLVKFLTFPPPGRDEPCALWAEISDKKHTIRARLSVDAILEYGKNPIHGGRSITSHKSALVSLKKFRLAFGRVARRDVGRGLTDESTLFLDVDGILLRGAFGEPVWGSPAEAVSDDPRIREWIHGLRQDGGAGNVLKLKKHEAMARAAEREAFEARAALKPPAKPPIQTTINTAAMDTKVRVARKSGALRSRTSLPSEDRFHTKVIKYFRPPDDILEQLMSLSGQALPTSAVKRRTRPRSRSDSRDGDHDSMRPLPSQSASPERPTHKSRALTPPSSPPPRSPSHWSPSERGSPQSRFAFNDDSETEEEPDLDAIIGEDATLFVPDKAGDSREEHSPEPPETNTNEDDSQAADHSSFSLTMPPPAQPRRPLDPTDVPYASSQVLTQSQPPAQLADYDLPPSSFPMPPSSFQDRPSSPLDTYQRASHRLEWGASEPLIRRVPPPICNALRPDPDASGDGRVLVENSDTASPGSQRVGMSQSQSQNQSQSQSQSHGRSQDAEGADSQESQLPQSQPPSKLRNEIERARSRSPPEEEDQDARLHGNEELAQESQPRIDDDVPMAEAPPVQEGPQVPSRELELQHPTQSQSQSHSEESQKSRQSLSYKGDSQSQDKAAEEAKAPAAAPEVEAVVISGTEHDPVYENEGAPAVGVLKENLQLAGANEHEHRSPSPPPSPMRVDGQLPLVTDTPTWVAIRSVPSPDGGDGDSQEEANVDELLSDPIDVDQDARPAARAAAKTGRKGAGNVRGKRRLDPDDARTAEMVDQYVSEVRQKDNGKSKARSSATTTRRTSPRKASCSRQPTPPRDEVPQDRTTKRRKKDVEESGLPEGATASTSEMTRKPAMALAKGKHRERDGPPILDRRKASFALPVDDPPPSSQPAGHDPAVWAAPTFLLKPRKPTQDTVPPAPKVAVSASSTSSKVAGRRRPASGSPEPQNEARPAKKRKTSSAAVPVVGPVAASGTEQQQAERSAGKYGVTVKAPSTRPAQQSLKKGPQASVSGRASDAGSGSGNVKYVDLRAASRSSSRSSSRAPQAGSRGSSAARNRMPDEQPAVPEKGKAPIRSARIEKGTASSSVPPKPPALPVMSGAKTVSSRAAAREALGVPRASSSRSSSHPATAESRVHASVPPILDAAEVPRPPQPIEVDEGNRPALDEYRVSLELVKEPGGPPVLSWEDVLQILRRTGWYRRKATSSTRERDN